MVELLGVNVNAMSTYTARQVCVALTRYWSSGFRIDGLGLGFRQRVSTCCNRPRAHTRSLRVRKRTRAVFVCHEHEMCLCVTNTKCVLCVMNEQYLAIES